MKVELHLIIIYFLLFCQFIKIERTFVNNFKKYLHRLFSSGLPTFWKQTLTELKVSQCRSLSSKRNNWIQSDIKRINIFDNKTKIFKIKQVIMYQSNRRKLWKVISNVLCCGSIYIQIIQLNFLSNNIISIQKLDV